MGQHRLLCPRDALHMGARLCSVRLRCYESVLAPCKAMSDDRICLYENISAFHRIFSFLTVRHIRFVLMTTPD